MFRLNKRLYHNPYLYQSRNIAEGFVSLLCTCVILCYGNHLIDCQIVGKSGECDVVTTSTHLENYRDCSINGTTKGQSPLTTT